MEIIDRLSAGDPEKEEVLHPLVSRHLEPELENLQGARHSQDKSPFVPSSQTQEPSSDHWRREAHAIMAQQSRPSKKEVKSTKANWTKYLPTVVGFD